MAKRVTDEMIRERLFKRVGNEYTLVSGYKGGEKKVDLYHTVCDGIYSVTPNHFFYDGSRCKCQWNIRQPEDFEEEFDGVSQGRYEQLDRYRRNIEKIRIRHLECGEVFPMTPKSFLQGQGCPECFGNKTKTTEEFSREVDELTDGEFTLESEYVNNRTLVTLRHIDCGRSYPVIPKDFLRGNRCPHCKQSKGERMVREILDKHQIDYDIEKAYRDLTSRYQKLPFDFYLPEYNVLIEYDGIQHFKEVQHFGGIKKLRSQRRRDALKNKYAYKNGIGLLRIPYMCSEKESEKIILSYLKWTVKQKTLNQKLGL